MDPQVRISRIISDGKPTRTYPNSKRGGAHDRRDRMPQMRQCGIHALETEPIESIWDGSLFDLPSRSTQPTKKEKPYA